MTSARQINRRNKSWRTARFSAMSKMCRKLAQNNRIENQAKWRKKRSVSTSHPSLWLDSGSDQIFQFLWIFIHRKEGRRIREMQACSQHLFYRARLKGGPQVWWNLFLLLPINPAWLACSICTTWGLPFSWALYFDVWSLEGDWHLAITGFCAHPEMWRLGKFYSRRRHSSRDLARQLTSRSLLNSIQIDTNSI